MVLIFPGPCLQFQRRLQRPKVFLADKLRFSLPVWSIWVLSLPLLKDIVQRSPGDLGSVCGEAAAFHGVCLLRSSVGIQRGFWKVKSYYFKLRLQIESGGLVNVLVYPLYIHIYGLGGSGFMYMKAGVFGGEMCWLSLELELQVVVNCPVWVP